MEDMKYNDVLEPTVDDMKYNDVLERAKKAIKDCGDNIESINAIKSIFPELSESEDEKIRKKLLSSFKDIMADADEDELWYGLPYNVIIAWLEKMKDFDKKLEKAYKANSEEIFDYGYKAAKAELGKEDDMDPRWKYAYDLIIAEEMYQMSMNDEMVEEAKTKALEALHNIGNIDNLLHLEKRDEQKLADNVKPKFKVGDWVIDEEDNHVYQVERVVTNVSSGMFGYDLSDGSYFYSTKTNYHLWSIADAKDGDVLATKNYIYIFNSIDNETETVAFYCLMKKSDEHFSFGDYKIHDEILNSVPATKEEYELFFRTMNEAGYKWDEENKKVIKNSISPKFKVGDCIVTPENKVLQITSINGTSYEFDNVSHYWEISYCDKQCHLWTIEDAKDGDILVDEAEDELCIFIFKNIDPEIHAVKTHCTFFTDDAFDNGCLLYIDTVNTKPATKEQQERLFSKMKEKGYEWDAEEKELKKLDNSEQIYKNSPKFKVGDWAVNQYGYIRQIIDIKDDCYYCIRLERSNFCSDTIENPWQGKINYVDEQWHKWSIEDAKDGDVLAAHECYVIFKEIDGLNIKCYCTYHYMGLNPSFHINTLQNKTAFHPATEEEREQLFKKMEEEGYEWSAYKKELKKLDNSAQICKNIPMFKVGDWVVDEEDKHVYQVRRVISSPSNELFAYDLTDNGYFYFTKTDYHLWDIYDIKNGDVLALNNDCIILVKDIIYNPISGWKVSCWCNLVDGEFDVVEYSTGIEGLHPATKEQCDKLFKIMAVNGYEWDAENKQLKKTPNALEECEIEHIEHGKYYYCIKDYYYAGKKEVSKGEVVQALKGMPIMGLGVKANEYFIPVKSIVDVKHAWSDEDEYMLGETIQHLEELIRIDKAKHCACDVQYYQRDIDWIKSLKQRYIWKPNEKQMNALDSTLQYSQVSHDSYEHLNSLFNDLKKLK